MKAIINKILDNHNKNPFILLIGGLIYILMIILGVFCGVNENSLSIFVANVNNYYLEILSLNSTILTFFLKRILNILLFFTLICLLSLNKFTYFICFLLIGYRGFILGISFNVIISVFSINGFIIWLFLILVQNLLLTFAILIFMINVWEIINCFNKFNKKLFIRYLIISLIIALLGAFSELFLIFSIFRPLNLYF